MQPRVLLVRSILNFSLTSFPARPPGWLREETALAHSSSPSASSFPYCLSLLSLIFSLKTAFSYCVLSHYSSSPSLPLHKQETCIPLLSLFFSPFLTRVKAKWGGGLVDVDSYEVQTGSLFPTVPLHCVILSLFLSSSLPPKPPPRLSVLPYLAAPPLSHVLTCICMEEVLLSLEQFLYLSFMNLFLCLPVSSFFFISLLSFFLMQ